MLDGEIEPSDLVPQTDELDDLKIKTTRSPLTMVCIYQNLLAMVHNILKRYKDEASKNEQMKMVIGQLIESVELLCFDIGMCDYIFDPKKGSALEDLFERCFAYRDHSFAFDYQRPELFVHHLNYLIEKISYFQSNTELHQSNCPSFDSIDPKLLEKLQSYTQRMVDPSNTDSPNTDLIFTYYSDYY